MHPFNFITTTVIALASTSVLAIPTSPATSPRHTGLTGLPTKALQSPADLGAFSDIDSNELFADLSSAFDSDPSSDLDNESFSRVPLTSLQLDTSFYKYCFLGKCRHRHYRRARCPEGYRVVAFKRCGRTWWWVRAICCPYRHEEDCLRGLGELGGEDFKTYDQLEMLD